jgi:hypoxanthine phosphoribosyltransferase
MEKILIIDDISDSGDSFNHTIKMLGDLKTVATAALYVKRDTVHTPMFSGIVNIEKTQWISFPWENI